MNNLLGKDFVGHLKSKVQDAGAAIQDAQRRVTQQVLEATGNADRSDFDDEPEMRTHLKLEGLLKRLYPLTDKYYRAVHGLCELTTQMAQEFATELDDEPELQQLAQELADASNSAMRQHGAALGQAMHRCASTMNSLAPPPAAAARARALLALTGPLLSPSPPPAGEFSRR